MSEYDELLQILMKNDRVFNYCYQYFIEDVWKMRDEPREVLAAAMASWIPWEPSADKLIARVRELAGE